MSWFESVSLKSPTDGSALPAFGAQQAALAQIGAMSPLWMLFMGASTMGVAYWSMTRWMRLATPEKVAGSVVKLRLVKPAAFPAAIPVPDIEPVPIEDLQAPEPLAEPMEAAVEAAAKPAEAVVDAVAESVEAVGEPVAKAVAKAKPVRAAKAKAPVKAVAVEAVPVKAAPVAKTAAPRKAPVRRRATKA